MNMISVREHPGETDTVIAYFQKHWASEDSMRVYDDCIRSCIHAKNPLPQWYLLRQDVPPHGRQLPDIPGKDVEKAETQIALSSE